MSYILNSRTVLPATYTVVPVLLLLISIALHAQDKGKEDLWQQQIDAGIEAAEDLRMEDRTFHFKSALEIAEKFEASDIRLFETRVRLAGACGRPASCEEEELKSAYAAAVNTREMVRRETPKEADRYATLLEMLSDAAKSRDLYDDGVKYSREVLKFLQEHKRPGDSQVAAAHKHLAWSLDAAGNHAEAREVMNQGMEVFDKAPKLDVEAKALFLESSALLYAYHDDQSEPSEKEYQRSLDVREKAWGDQDIRYLDALSRLTSELSDEVYEYGATDFLDRLIARSVALRLRKHGENSTLYWEALDEQASYYFYSDQLDLATERYQSFYTVIKKYPGEKEQRKTLAASLEGLARVFAQRGDKEQTIARGEEGIQLLEEEQKRKTGNDRFVASPYDNLCKLHRLLATTYLELARYDDSERHFNRYASLLRKDYPIYVGKLAKDLGGLYMERKQYERAIPKLEEAVGTEEATATDNSQGTLSRLDTLRKLTEAYTATGRHEDANRVSLIVLQLAMQTISKDASAHTTWKTALAVILVMFGVLCALGILAGFGYYYFRRKLLQRIEKLYFSRPMENIFVPAAEAAVSIIADPLSSTAFTLGTMGQPATENNAHTLAVDSGPPEAFGQTGESARIEPQYVADLSLLPNNVLQPKEEVAAGHYESSQQEATTIHAACVMGLPEVADDGATTTADGTVDTLDFVGSQAAGGSTSVPPPPPAIAPPPFVQPTASVPERPRMSLSFSGEGTTLFALRVRNLLITLLTLGVYSFWGKALVRRYLIGQISVDQDRLAFHGTGKELLLGWLRASPFLALIIFLPNVLPLLWKTPQALIVGQLIVFGAIGLLVPIARAGAYRYRLNRTSWRGIRFSFQGSTLRMLKLYLQAYLLIPLTVGLYTPYFVVRTEREQLGHSAFGDRNFQFSGKGSELLPCFMCSLPLGILSLGLFWPWYRALRSRYLWANTTYGDARFRSHATGLGLLGLWSGNLAILMFTLGLGSSWTLTRTLRFWSQHIEVVGDPLLGPVRQSAASTNAAGESFTDFLGFEFGV